MTLRRIAKTVAKEQQSSQRKPDPANDPFMKIIHSHGTDPGYNSSTPEGKLAQGLYVAAKDSLKAVKGAASEEDKVAEVYGDVTQKRRDKKMMRYI